MRASVELAEAGLNVAVVTKVHPVRSHSVAAQGGINAAMNKADSWKDHMYDTAKGSDFLGDQDAIEVLCKEAPENIKELERMGAIFNRDEKGSIAQRPFGGAGYARTCYLADRTGHGMLHVIFEQMIRRGVYRYNEWHVVEVIVEDGVARGVIAIELLTGKLHRLHAKAVLLATGGYGRVFSASTNALSSTGDGMSLADLRFSLPIAEKSTTRAFSELIRCSADLDGIDRPPARPTDCHASATARQKNSTPGFSRWSPAIDRQDRSLS